MTTIQSDNLDFEQTSRILNLPEAVDDKEPTTKGYVDQEISTVNGDISSLQGDISNINGELDGIDTALTGKKVNHGVEAIGARTWSDANHALTLASITYWYKGVKYTTANPIVCDLDLTADRDNSSNTLTTDKLYYFYFKDATGKLYWSDTLWSFTEHVFVATVFWNGTNGALQREFHNHTRDISWHENAHDTIGTRFETGSALTYPTVGSPALLQIETGKYHDEDQEYATGQCATMRGWYQNSAGHYTFRNYSLPYLGTSGQPQYLDTDTYTLQNIGATDYGVFWVYMSLDESVPCYIVPTHAATAYNNLTQARAASNPVLLGSNINHEVKLVYKFIYKGDGSFVEHVDYRESGSLPGGSIPSPQAKDVGFAPYKTLASTNVQQAMQELLDEGGSSAGGINYISNYTFETDTTGWATYADAAGSSPVDGTGGSANITFARSLTTPLRGLASGLLTKDAADRQGQGISYDFTIDSTDKNSVLSITLDMLASAAFVKGDITLWVYDKDNSVLIEVRDKELDPIASKVKTTFNATSATNYRLIFHISTTNANAYTLKIDTVTVGPQAVLLGPAMSDWISAGTVTVGATVTPPTKGTTSVDAVKYRRVGDSAEIVWQYTQTGAGNAGSGTYLLTLPAGLQVDPAKTRVNPSSFAPLASNEVGFASFYQETTYYGLAGVYAYDATRLYVAVIYDGGGAAGAFWGSGTFSFVNTNISWSIVVKVPIAGWSTNVVSSESRTFKISSYLANGTRVTGSAPTILGQYRSYIRTGGGVSYSETNASPGTVPTVANGILLYGGENFATSDPNNEPSKYEIFVGKNKHVSIETYASAGRTDPVYIDDFFEGITSCGTRYGYDPTTGIIVVAKAIHGGAAANQYCGVKASDNSSVANLYFDLIVSDNALAVQSEPLIGQQEVRVTGGNGHGSVNTKIRRFSTVVTNAGSAILYADSPTLGASFTIIQPGIYTIVFSDYKTNGIAVIGISLNSSQLTTAIDLITNADRRAYAQQYSAAGAGDDTAFCGTTLYLPVGSIIRPHTDGAPTSTSNAQSYFSITQVGR